MGAGAAWDPGGLATRIRARLDAMPMLGGWYRRLPSWAFRALGVLCFTFGIGQLIFVYAVTHGT